MPRLSHHNSEQDGDRTRRIAELDLGLGHEQRTFEFTRNLDGVEGSPDRRRRLDSLSDRNQLRLERFQRDRSSVGC